MSKKQPENLIGSGHGEISPRDIGRINQRIHYALETGEPLQLYIGSCPDYAHDGQAYTFQSVGEDVPLLTRKQIEANQPLFTRLESLWRTISMQCITSGHRSGRPVFCG